MEGGVGVAGELSELADALSRVREMVIAGDDIGAYEALAKALRLRLSVSPADGSQDFGACDHVPAAGRLDQVSLGSISSVD